MTSNINDFDNFNNNEQNAASSIKNQFLNFISTIPFCIKSLLIINITFYILSIISNIFSYYLSNIPKYTILSFQIWRLITANLLSTGFMNILCLFFFWLPQAINLERSIGTIKYMVNFFINSTLIQLLYSVFIIIMGIFIKGITDKKIIYYHNTQEIYYIESDGLWPYIMMEMTVLCLANPDNNMNIFCIPYQIKSKYYPFSMLIFLFIINFSIRFDFIAGVFYGFIYVFYLKNSLEIPEQKIEYIENLMIFNSVRESPSFIKKSKIDASFLLGNNMNNYNEYNNYDNNNQRNNGYTPYSGMGTQVGSNV